MALVVILITGLVTGAVVTAILLTSRDGDTRAEPAGTHASTTPTPGGSAAAGGSGGPQSGARPLPPPTPTGRPYDDEPAVGACVDIARGSTGLVLYQADCADPAASLIVDNTQPEKCQGEGFWGLRGLSRRILCFTYNVTVGDCVDLDIPRRAPCSPTTAPTGQKGKVTITEVHRGQQTGDRCASPDQFLQNGKGEDRGIACFDKTSTDSAPSPPSR